MTLPSLGPGRYAWLWFYYAEEKPYGAAFTVK